jgi:pyridoxamine 5'-phosphate oxidase
VDDETLASWRQDYTADGLVETDLAADPVEQFGTWLQQARVAGLYEPNAMVVSTVGEGGQPSSRAVLLKGLSVDGFVFYTNYRSRKAAELRQQGRCALLFLWHPLQRQVRVEGAAAPVPGAVSDAYFASRPRGAQLGAWASEQSSVVVGRDALEQEYAEAAARWPEASGVPRPDHWGGYLVRPATVEFWQGRANRLHDRLRYRRDEADWVVERLAP